MGVYSGANYDELDIVGLRDLLDAYNDYIQNASEGTILDSGWRPVCVEEFYENEYQSVWKQGGDFSYLQEDWND